VLSGLLAALKKKNVRLQIKNRGSKSEKAPLHPTGEEKDIILKGEKRRLEKAQKG